MQRRAVILLFAFGLLICVDSRLAESHIPPPAYVTASITDDRTEIVVTAYFEVFQRWFGIAPADLAPDDLTAEHRAAIETTLQKALHVQVDGAPVVCALEQVAKESFEDHLQTWNYVKLRLAHTTQVPPQQVALAWTLYGSKGHVFEQVDVELDAYGESYYPVFKEREPEYVWHRPREVVKPPPPVLPQPVESPHVEVPLGSIVLLLAMLIAAVGLRKRLRLAKLALLLAIGVLGFAALMPFARIDVPRPWGESVLVRPADEEALAVFASLHRAVYTAFDGRTEDEIYESLDACVTGELLPTLYGDIYESMILRNEGGAVARIQKTEIVDAEVLPGGERNAPWFEVRARWRVKGKLGHWGHTHQRINEYQAEITVLAADGRWKIAEVKVLDHVRVDDGKEVRDGG